VEAAEPNQIWQSDMTKIWAGPTVGWAYLVSVIDCCSREIISWNLSHRGRTEEALDAVDQASADVADFVRFSFAGHGENMEDQSLRKIRAELERHYRRMPSGVFPR
jgi:hypothetical protein